jgi:hypothetical protein
MILCDLGSTNATIPLPWSGPSSQSKIEALFLGKGFTLGVGAQMRARVLCSYLNLKQMVASLDEIEQILQEETC